MYDDIDVKTDANQTGSLFFKLKRPLDGLINLNLSKKSGG